MNLPARAAALAMSAMLLAGCGAEKVDAVDPAAPASPSVGQFSAAPPPLASALPLPENAVGNAVAKLDEMAQDLMAKSGIPGL
nr:serine hydrolase [Actinomycetes bacterium]